MRRLLLGTLALAATTLLAGCNGGNREETVEDDTTILCPGGSNCPADGSWVGLLIKDDVMIALGPEPSSSISAPAPATTDTGAAPSTGPETAAAPGAADEAGAAAAPTTQAGPTAARTGRPTICPGRPSPTCPRGVSGLIWPTPEGNAQRVCNPSTPCVDGMKTGYYGWLCLDRPSGTCDGVPRGKSNPN